MKIEIKETPKIVKKEFKIINKNETVKSVHLQSLEPKDESFEVFETSINFMDYIDNKKYIKQYYKSETVPSNVKASSLFSMFVLAYNNHKDVLLTPDMIWTHICMNFSYYVKKHGKKLRNKFVDHEGQKELVIVTVGTNEKDYYEWNSFFGSIIDKIKEEVKGNVVETLEADFTTTGLLEKTISTVCIMDSFKEYFQYTRLMSKCGIENIHFTGTEKDWKKIIEKVEKLDEYDVDGKWKSYSKGLLEVLNEFLSTYQDNPNVDYWNKIMNFEEGRNRSGQSGKTTISGWILKLYYSVHNKKSVDFDEIKSELFTVPIKVINDETKEIRFMEMIGGFTGMCYENNTFSCQISLAILGVNSPEEKKKVKKRKYSDEIDEEIDISYKNEEVRKSIYKYE